jgi:hypothetical protein
MVKWGKMSTVPNTEHQSKPVRGEIKLGWKAAIAEAWRKRARRHITQTVLVLVILGIFSIFQDGAQIGVFRWIAIGVLLLVINVGDDARLQRKASRNSWWTYPTTKVNNVR